MKDSGNQRAEKDMEHEESQDNINNYTISWNNPKILKKKRIGKIETRAMKTAEI